MTDAATAHASNTRNNRRAPRISSRLDVVLKFPERDQRYQTHDISYVGVFIECPDPLPLRKLIRFQAKLDGGDVPVELIGVVAHRINSADAVETGRPTGMGLQLFGISQEMRETWREFVHGEYEKDPAMLEEITSMDQPRLKLRFPNTQEMQTFARDHVATGQVFIRSADLYQQGACIKVEAIHPDNGQSILLDAEVVEFIEAPRNNRGMRLSFPDPEAATQTLLQFS